MKRRLAAIVGKGQVSSVRKRRLVRGCPINGVVLPIGHTRGLEMRRECGELLFR
jgi:hypothetical protein